jgi:hypothetical protein
VVVLVATLTVPLNASSSPKGLCEEFRRETMAMFVEQVLAKDAREDVPGSFETSMLDHFFSRWTAAGRKFHDRGSQK